MSTTTRIQDLAPAALGRALARQQQEAQRALASFGGLAARSDAAARAFGKTLPT